MGGAAPTPAGDPGDVLRDLPQALWLPLLRAVRRAVDGVERGDLPAALRPFAMWKPEALLAERPRSAIAAALLGDHRLREAVGEAIEDADAWRAAASRDVARLVDAHGADVAAAALAARGRWEDLAVLAASETERLAAKQRAGAEAAERREAAAQVDDRRRLAGDLAAVRAERDVLRRRADAAEQRARVEDNERQELRAEVERLTARVAELQAEVDAVRERGERRLTRTRRRLAAAEDRARVDADRARAAVERLEALAGELRAALGDRSGAREQQGAQLPEPATPRAPVPVPRELPAAQPGRPCRLPAGIAGGTAAAVRAVLRVRDLEVVLDGYNVVFDARGCPNGTLVEQRAWLVRVAGAVAARYRHRVTIVFDGARERASAPTPRARGVLVTFSADGETADERIVALARSRPEVPLLVVSTDRAVQEACLAAGADVASSGVFLDVVAP